MKQLPHAISRLLRVQNSSGFFVFHGTKAIIVVGETAAAYALVRAFGHDTRTTLTEAASLAQIGGFSWTVVEANT